MRIEISNVYHYTSLETFFKLLDGIQDDNFIMYASRISDLNDSSELKYGFRKIWKLLPYLEDMIGVKNEYRLSKLPEKDNSISEEVFLKELIKNVIASRYAPFVLSFSEHKDYLPMWSLYGSHGNGVALGFKMQYTFVDNNNKIWDLTKWDNKMPHTLKISYGKYKLKDNALRYAEIKYKEYNDYVECVTNEEELLKKQLGLISDICVIAGSLLKHPSFEYEKESRYFCFAPSTKDIKFRTNAKGNIIPYLEVKIPFSLLSKVIIGPCRAPQKTEDILKIRMNQIGLDPIKIEKSKIPYREY